MALALEALAGQRIWVALAEEGGPYAEAAAELRHALGSTNELTIEPWQTLLDTPGAPPDLLVTVGLAAFDGAFGRLAERDAAWQRLPLLATLLPQHAYESRTQHLEPRKRALSAVWLDQPFKRQMVLLKRVLPERRRLGVLLGPQSRDLLPALQREARGAGFSLAFQSVMAREKIYPVLRQVLDESDVLLAVPEPDIYNATTLQHILLTAYRGRVPVVAFSAAYVKAGAVLALYSTPAQVMQRAGEMILNWQAGRGLPPPQSPRDFSVVINTRVAASLGLSLDAAADIEKDLRRLEGLK